LPAAFICENEEEAGRGLLQTEAVKAGKTPCGICKPPKPKEK